MRRSLLGSLLLLMALTSAGGTLPAASAPVEMEGDARALDRVEVTVVGDMDAALSFIADLGAVVELRSRDRIQLRIPPDRLPELERATSLVTVERPAVVLPLQTSPVALERIGADLWHDAGFTGHGVTIAVVDAGFRGYEEALGTTLPVGVTARSFRADGDIHGGTDHGLRAAQIAHQVAPGARLHLVNFSTLTEFSAAVDYVIEQQVDVVSFSLGFIHNGAGNGTGAVNEIVSRSTDAGAAWAVAAGNWAEQHWAGVFTDTDGDSVHEFEPGVQENGHAFTAGDLIVVSLRWDDTWGMACSDYDLELFGPNGALVRASRTIQACSGDPVEALQVLATETGEYAVRIIEAQSDTPRMLDLMVVGSPDRGAPLEISEPAGSLSQPADHAQVLTVGALASDNLSREAGFSSRGPTSDGRLKPEVLGPTGLATEQTQAFAGTSASAPHLAGMLALLREAQPESTATGLRADVVGRSMPAESNPGGTTGVRIANLGSVSGLGPLLPPGVDQAGLTGTLPPTGGLALVSYQGPDGYPLRFGHLLTNGQDVEAAFRLELATQRFQVFIRGAPEFVSDLHRLDNGDIVILRLAPAVQPEGAVAQIAR